MEDQIEEAITAWALNYRPTLRTGTATPTEVGQALKEIRDKRLYRAVAPDFYLYCARRWGRRPDQIDALIALAEGQIPIQPEEQSTEKDSDTKGLIYFLAGEGLVKIGFTRDIKKRVSAIQNMSPVPLEIVATMEAERGHEKELHERFMHLHQRGEWFCLSGDLVTFIQEISPMFSLSAPENSAVLASMTAEEARTVTEMIKHNLQTARQLLLEMYEREGWSALGYSSWREYGRIEFGFSESRAYQLMDAARVERNISTIVEKTDDYQLIPEAQLRPLAGLDPEQQREVWQQVVGITTDTGGRITAALVEQVVETLTQPKEPPVQSPEPQAVARPMARPQPAPPAFPERPISPAGRDVSPEEGGLAGSPSATPVDDLFQKAVDICRESNKTSISLLQRRLRIPYTRAARLMDQLEEHGIVGPDAPGSNVRRVLPADSATPRRPVASPIPSGKDGEPAFVIQNGQATIGEMPDQVVLTMEPDGRLRVQVFYGNPPVDPDVLLNAIYQLAGVAIVGPSAPPGQSEAPAPPPPAAPVPPAYAPPEYFPSRDAAVWYAIGRGAYPEYRVGRKAYDEVNARWHQTTTKERSERWIEKIDNLLAGVPA